MLEQLVYKNHLNEVFSFGRAGIYINSSDIHDYEWKVKTKGKRITGLQRDIGSRKLPIVIMCDTEEKGIHARNLLFETVEKDALAMEYGQIILNGYYFRCMVTKSSKANYLKSKRYMTLNLTLQSDHPYWVKETQTSFKADSETVNRQDTGIDYPYDFDHDYLLPKTTTLFNGGFVPANFRAVIYGPCEDPSITIGGHRYQVNCTVGAGERLVLDTMQKTIRLKKNGTETNVFHARSRDSYCFEPVPSGNSAVLWNGEFGFDITVMEERSEPKWI